MGLRSGETERRFALVLLAYLAKKRLWKNTLDDRAEFYGDKLLRPPCKTDSPFIPHAEKGVEREEIAENPRNIVMMLKGSMTGDVERLAGGIHEATLIWSMWGGYLQEKSSAKLLDFVARHRIRMVHRHTGGHADMDTLERVIRALRPKRVIPVHTFHPEAFKDICETVVSASDGVAVER